jgi:hypothetical protein
MSRHLWLPIFMGAGKIAVFEPETSAYLITIGIPNDGTVFYPATAQEITGSQIWTAVNNYVLALKAADIAGAGWTNSGTATCLMLRDYLFIGGTALRHGYNLANPNASSTFFGSWVHDGLGITGNGANTYAVDGVRNTDLADKREVYHGHISVDFGSPAGGGMWVWGARIPGLELSYLRINTNAYGCPNTGIAPAQAFSGTVVFTGDFAQRRINFLGQNVFSYWNGNQVNVNTAETTVPADINLDVYIGALNQNNAVVNPFLGTIRHHFIANEATLAQHNAWHAARVALQTALHRMP